jgi:ZIP family zinc transporter
MEVVLLVLAASGTAFATGLGALPVYSRRLPLERVRPVLWGLVAGIMSVASIQGLIIPGFEEGSDLAVVAGVAVGVVFLLVARRWVGHHDVGIGGIQGAGARRAALVFGALFVHSLPEGLALGAAWASGTAGLGVYVFLAIALQNVPEGTATAIPLRDAGVGRARAFWLATLTSAPQPVGAVLAYALVEATHAMLPASFGFAAGAMLALVVLEVAPVAFTGPRRGAGLAGALAGAAGMVTLGLLLGAG